MTTRERLNALLERRPDLDFALIASHTTLDRKTLSLMSSGQRHSKPETELQVNQVIDQIEAGSILRPGDPAAVEIAETIHEGRVRVQRNRGFYLIETVKRVRQVLDYCVEHAAIGVITADYGVGKTESIAHWRRTGGRNVEHVVFEFDEFSARNVADFIECLADRLQIPHRLGPVNSGRTMRAVCAGLQANPVLLIFDQCESVYPRILQIIRQVWDHTRKFGVGIVLLSSPLLLTKLQGKRSMDDVGALTSRVGVWASLRGVQKEEAINILRQEGVADIDDDAMDLIWRATGGSMRRLMAIADLLVTKHAGKPVTEKTVVGVAQNLWGLHLQGARNAA